MEIDEPQLVRRAADGDSAAFTRLYNRYWGRCFGYALARLGNLQDAEDATQEAMVRVWRGLAGFEQRDAAFGAWLRRVTVNAVTDYIKAETRRRAHEPYRLDAPVADGLVLADAFAAPDEIGEVDAALMLEALLPRIGPGQREYMLRRAHGYSSAEIAASAGVTPGRAKVAIIHGRRRLAALWAE